MSNADSSNAVNNRPARGRPRDYTSEEYKVRRKEKQNDYYSLEKLAASKVGLEVSLLRLMRKVVNAEATRRMILVDTELSDREQTACGQLMDGGYIVPVKVRHHFTGVVTTGWRSTALGKETVTLYTEERKKLRTAHGSSVARKLRKLNEALAYAAAAQEFRKDEASLRRMRAMVEVLRAASVVPLTKEEVLELRKAGFSVELRKRSAKITTMKESD
jgi:hypothetical protein